MLDGREVINPCVCRLILPSNIILQRPWPGLFLLHLELMLISYWFWITIPCETYLISTGDISCSMTLSASPAFCAGKALVAEFTEVFPVKRPVIQNRDDVFVVSLIITLSKQPICWWHETNINSYPPRLKVANYRWLLSKVEKLWLFFNSKYHSWGVIDTISSLVSIMAWRRIGDKLLSIQRIARYSDTYMRH